MKPIKTSERTRYLTSARNLIEDKRRWCQHRSYKRSLFGGLQFCAIGAMRKASMVNFSDFNAKEPPQLRAAINILHEAAEVSSKGRYHSIMDVNDDGTHKEVLKAFDLAIQLSINLDLKIEAGLSTEPKFTVTKIKAKETVNV